MSAPVVPTRILFVCTGNICRSPMAQYFLTDRLGAGFSVTSAGTAALTDYPMHVQTERVLRERGIASLDDFRARYLTADLVAGADLVIGLSREHRDHASASAPMSWRRVVTLRELDTYIAGGGALTSTPQIAADRNRDDLDIADPMHQPPAAFDTLAAELDPLIDRLAGWLRG
ncbi:low molecular weight phosphatase family protein [Williamsia herbipolensis]|uniref:arsenate-mycothiol transferase ArsC n=1 Tax=Williamsia herbipolensis TaxID=1603258 RepID=UPI0005F7F721|nr:low molecular weight phosphatase family protein [Williamsia herbipolensis]